MLQAIREASSLFFYFFRIGWFTFGGGWNIVAQMQKDFVEKNHEITDTELLDIVSVGRSLPGIMIGNVAYLFGYHQAGTLGGVFALLGMTLPSMVILAVLTFCYASVRDNVWVAKALIGVRAAVVPIITTAAFKLRKGAFSRRACYALCAAACILSVVFHVSCVLIVAFGAAAGLIMARIGGKPE